MSRLKERIVGLLLVLFVFVFGIWYSLCIFANSYISQGLDFPCSNLNIDWQPNFFGIPLLNEYWTLALPLYVLILVVLFIIGWLGFATFQIGEPKISEEEMKHLKELDKAMRNKKEK